MMRWRLLLLVPLSVSGCAGASGAERARAASPAIEALARGDMRRADREAQTALERDAKNPRAALARAIARYERTMKQLNKDMRTLLVGGVAAGGLNQRYLTAALEQAEKDLGAVDADLEIAASDAGFSLDICIACWEKDWNGNGRVDDRDRLLFQIEQDADGKPIPEGDPRRKPTIRFDHGDLYWARAFVAFQRAALDLVLAYDYGELDRLFAERNDRPANVVIRLVNPERVHEAKRQILAGLSHSNTSRKSYLAETDDEREWLPNPRQKSHPLPLPVDASLYDTWQSVVSDLERLVRGQEGLSVAELANLGDHRSKRALSGYIDVGSFFSSPSDITLDVEKLERFERSGDVEGTLRSLLGRHYVQKMKASPLPKRLERMQGEVERGHESLERKLRYLLWVN